MKKNTSAEKIYCQEVRNCVADSVKRYLNDLNGEDAEGLHRLLISEVEKPLLKAVLRHTQDNHSRAARILGMNRSTLRKKLQHHQIT